MNEIKSWYSGLNQRELILVNVLALALAILLIFVLIIMPLKNYHANLTADHDGIMSQAETVKQQVAVLAGTTPAAKTSQPLAKLINQSSKRYGLNFSSIQERKRNKEIQLRIDDAEFDQFIRWISELEQKNGLVIETLRISDTEATGKVDISLKVLKAG